MSFAILYRLVTIQTARRSEVTRGLFGFGRHTEP